MALRPDIIMAGRQPNMVNVLANSAQAAGMQNEVVKQNRLAQLYNEQGPAIMSGDRNALNAYAKISPEAALGVQGTRLGMDVQSAQLEQLRFQTKTAMENLIRTRGQEEAAQIAAQEQRAVKAALAAPSQEALDAFLTQNGMEDFVGVITIENRDMYASQYIEGMSDAFEQFGPKTVDEPAAIQALRIRAQEAGLEPGTPEYEAFMREGGRKPDQINVYGDQVDQRPMADKPPKGFQRRWDEENQTWVDEPIPGSVQEREATEADQAAEVANQKTQVAAADYERKFSIVDDKLTDAINTVEEKGRLAAGVGTLLQALPESAARDFKSTLDTIKANLGFEELQAMRDASPTGGALGQVAIQEIMYLQAMQGSLDAAQSPEQLLDVLKDIRKRRREFRAERQRILNGGENDAPMFSGWSKDELLNSLPKTEEEAAAWNRRWDELEQ